MSDTTGRHVVCGNPRVGRKDGCETASDGTAVRFLSDAGTRIRPGSACDILNMVVSILGRGVGKFLPTSTTPGSQTHFQ